MISPSTSLDTDSGVSPPKNHNQRIRQKGPDERTWLQVAQIVRDIRSKVENRVRQDCPDDVSAEDVVTEAICRLFNQLAEHPEKFPSVAIVPRWLFTAARFIAMEEARDHWRQNRVDSPEQDGAADGDSFDWAYQRAGVLSGMETPEEVVQARETLAILTMRCPDDVTLLRASMEPERTGPISNTERSQRLRARERVYRTLERLGAEPPADLKPRRPRTR